MRGMELK
jgi:hypothetical protein